MMLDVLMTPVRKIVGLWFPGWVSFLPKTNHQAVPIEFSVSPVSFPRGQGHACGSPVSFYRDCSIGCVNVGLEEEQWTGFVLGANQMTTRVPFFV